MRIDRRELGRHYALMEDEALLDLSRDDLTDAAQRIYDLEIARRGLNKNPRSREEKGVQDGDSPQSDAILRGTDPAPDWMEGAAVACTFVSSPGNAATEKASRAQTVLQAACIPSCLGMTAGPEAGDEHSSQEILNVLVPVELAPHAASILDRDLLNEEFEAEWRDQLNMLSDKDLLVLDPAVFCAGLLDRAARMQRVYAEEIERRKLGK
jgi:hypothetical protein